MNEENTKKHQTEIFEYIRRRKSGKVMKVGVILGLLVGDTVKIGWSKCNIMADKFDASTGLGIAKNRAEAPKNTITPPPTPKCIKKQVRQFGSRCVRYFF
jgi:hypothetical protein